MPALVWRIMPARSISRCETICASAGFSFMVGRKYWLIRILVRSLLGCPEWPRTVGNGGYKGKRAARPLVLHRRMPSHFTRQPGENNARAGLQAQREQDQRPDRG